MHCGQRVLEGEAAFEKAHCLSGMGMVVKRKPLKAAQLEAIEVARNAGLTEGDSGETLRGEGVGR